MMVGTRSEGRFQAQPHILGGKSVQEYSPESESSDDDDEEIPHTSPPKSRIDPSIRSLDHRRKWSPQLDDDPSLQVGQFKRRKLGPAPYITREPPPNPVGVMLTRKGSRHSSPEDTDSSLEDTFPYPHDINSSPEDTVPIGLVSSVNAALKENTHGEIQQDIAPPSQQLDGRLSLQEEDTLVGSDHENIDVQGLNDQRESVTPGHNGTSSTPVSDHKDGQEPDDVSENEDNVQNNPKEGENLDIWDVPVSPEQPRSSKRQGPAHSLREASLRGGRIEVHIPLRRSEQTQFSQLSQARVAEQPQPSAEADHTTSPALIQPDTEVEIQQEELEDVEGDNAVEHIAGFLEDEENISDIDLSAEESFTQDVANFRTCHPEGYKDSETFDGPPEHDDVITHIDSSSLKLALRLMGNNAWAGLGSSLYRQSFRMESADTEPIRTLLQFLGKLDRLYVAAPKAPEIMGQNKFLNEYSDILGYYFSEINHVLEHLQERLRGGSNRSRINDDTSEQDKMSKEVVSLAIPMLFHVLASAWNLGGDDWGQTAFTISTVELLMRTLGWIELLYRPLLRGLKQTPVDEPDDEPDDEPAYQKRDRQTKSERREELDELLQTLRGAIEVAPEELEKEEQRRKRVHQGHQHKLERQEEIKAQWKREEEERKKAIEEQQWRSLMSIRGVHRPLSESSVPPSSVRSSSSRPVSTRLSSGVQSQAPQSPQSADDWSLEEKTFLFKKIQESYPDLLDLDDVRWSLNRTLAETEAKAEELLGLMLEAVHPEQAAAERHAHIQEVMQAYRRNWGHDVN
ncbi:hypothetical protein F4776DRAFT_237830 [Hypoxylon sp. NC0597]|nr:hypothetical protein F4776DRAFT_237830 [Hypoxylon sp. NC0597]